MLTCSIPRITADRLARLGLACADDSTTIRHIGVRVTPTGVRFCATNGRILASLIVPQDGITGTPMDLVLDQDQFTAALKTTAKGSTGRIIMQVDTHEVRLTNGQAVALIRRVDGTFPQVDHVWTRPTGRRWVPTISSIDPHLLSLAQRISGAKAPLLLASPVEVGAQLDALWSVPGPHPDAAIPLSHLRPAVSAPAYWHDHELALLIMPITRQATERQLDLSRHALALPAKSAQAA